MSGSMAGEEVTDQDFVFSTEERSVDGVLECDLNGWCIIGSLWIVMVAQ